MYGISGAAVESVRQGSVGRRRSTTEAFAGVDILWTFFRKLNVFVLTIQLHSMKKESHVTAAALGVQTFAPGLNQSKDQTVANRLLRH